MSLGCGCLIFRDVLSFEGHSSLSEAAQADALNGTTSLQRSTIGYADVSDTEAGVTLDVGFESLWWEPALDTTVCPADTGEGV